MKIAVTVTRVKQTGMEEWKDYGTTKIFQDDSTIKEIMSWARTLVKDISFTHLNISEVEEDNNID